MGAVGGPVALVGCARYEDAAEAIERAVELIGGWRIARADRVLIKPNVVMGAPPQRAVCTHPAVVGAAAARIVSLGAAPVVGESPGGPFNRAWVNRLLRSSGIYRAAVDAGALINEDFGAMQRELPEGSALRTVQLCSMLQGADALVNLCKLKMHGYATYTGAVKNLFGLVPGTHKAELHARFAQIERFAAMLNDVALAAGPALHIMDAVIGMEGEGPSHGEPRFVGAILASRDPWSLDDVAARLVGLSRQQVPQLVDAIERGLYDPQRIQLVGEEAERFAVQFALPAARARTGMFGGALGALIDAKPKVRKKRCVGCQICKNACPVGAITMQGGRERIDYAPCIRCYCCQELCPHNAIAIGRSFVGRFVR